MYENWDKITSYNRHRSAIARAIPFYGEGAPDVNKTTLGKLTAGSRFRFGHEAERPGSPVFIAGISPLFSRIEGEIIEQPNANDLKTASLISVTYLGHSER